MAVPDIAPPVSTRQTWQALTIITALAMPLFFFLLGAWGFFDPDEGRYGEIPREMLERHDWITPTLNYVKYFEKPPLLYWAVAASYKLFGLNEFAARLVPATAALLGLYIAYALGRRMFGHRAGLMAAVILATSLMWPILARELVIDMLLSVILFLALALWWLGHTDEGARQRGYYVAFWAALALGVLAKGPVAVVLVGAPIFLYLLVCRQWSSLSKMQWTLGVPLFFCITVPWFVLVAQRNPEFNHFFWYVQHVARYLGLQEDREHVQSFTYFFKFLPIALLPWSFFIPGALMAGWPRVWPARDEKQRAVLYLMISASFITLFFSGSTSKLVTYILPVVPLAAVLFAAYFDWLYTHRDAIWRGPLFSGVGLLSLVLGVGGVGCILIAPKKLYQIERLSPTIGIVAGVFLLLWVTAVVAMTMRRQYPGLLLAISGGMAILVTGIMPVIAAASPNHYCKTLIEYIRPGLKPETKIIMYESYAQSVSFYTGKRVVVKDLTELEFGIKQLSPQERQTWGMNNLSELRRAMNSATPIYCFARDHKAAQQLVRDLGSDVKEIYWNKRRSIIGNPAAWKLTPPKPDGLLGPGALAE